MKGSGLFTRLALLRAHRLRIPITGGRGMGPAGRAGSPEGQSVKARWRKALILGLLTGVVGLTAGFLPYGHILEENIGLDLLFQLRGPKPAPSDVAVIAIDEASADALKLSRDSKDWPRSYHARLVKKLEEQGASVIAFDVIFDKARSVQDDLLFARAIREAGNVVLLGYLERETLPLSDPSGSLRSEMTVEKLIPPTPVLAQGAAAFAPFPLPKVPITVSQFWTFKEGAGDFPTMPVTVLQVFARDAYDDLVRLLKKSLEDPVVMQAKDPINHASILEAQKVIALKKEEINNAGAFNRLIGHLKKIFGPDTLISRIVVKELTNPTEPFSQPGKGDLLKALVNMYKTGPSRHLNFYGPAQTVTTVPYFQALQPPGEEEVKERRLDFKGKAVFIGVSDLYPYKQGDTYRTVFSQSNGLDLSGVEIAATAFSNLLEGSSIRPIGFPTYFMTISFFGFAVGIICFLLRPVILMACSVALIVLYVGIASYEFTAAGLWFPVVIPIGLQGPFAFFTALLWKYLGTRKLEAEHEQLKELDRLKSMFLSHVSHELKTPLTSIKGFVDNMLDGVTGDLRGKQREYLFRVRANTERLARMIMNLLDLSRIESGTHQLDRLPLSLFELVQEALEQLRLIADSKRLTLVIICPDPTVRILADRDKIIQVITNLVDNAIKFTPAGGKITVGIGRQEPEQVMLTVTDTGEGIAPEALVKLFEPFYQASRQAGTHAKGLGLGLSIVRTLVELHGGTISVTSEVGNGSEFCILMPALKGDET